MRTDGPPIPMAGQDPPAPRARPRSSVDLEAPGLEPSRVGGAHPSVPGQEPRAAGLASPPPPPAANGRGRERASTTWRLSPSQTVPSQTVRGDQEDDHEALALLADRERIALDLNDIVIRRVFATSLALQSTAARAEGPELSRRLQIAIDELDRVISDIRSTVFDLETRRRRS